MKSRIHAQNRPSDSSCPLERWSLQAGAWRASRALARDRRALPSHPNSTSGTHSAEWKIDAFPFFSNLLRTIFTIVHSPCYSCWLNKVSNERVLQKNIVSYFLESTFFNFQRSLQCSPSNTRVGNSKMRLLHSERDWSEMRGSRREMERLIHHL